MNLHQWLHALLTGKPSPHHDPIKVALDQRQVQIASRLARLNGTTRDKILAEAYRRADRALRR